METQREAGVAREDEIISSNRTSSNMMSRKRSSDPRPERTGRPPQDKIHVVGLGSIGLFIAHSLKAVPWEGTPDVILVSHKKSTRDKWLRSPQRITCTVDGDVLNSGHYWMQFATPNRRYHGSEILPGNPLPKSGIRKAKDDATYHVTPEEFAEREKSDSSSRNVGKRVHTDTGRPDLAEKSTQEAVQQSVAGAVENRKSGQSIESSQEESTPKAHRSPDRIEAVSGSGTQSGTWSKEDEEAFNDELTPEQRRTLDQVDQMMAEAEASRTRKTPLEDRSLPDINKVGQQIARSSDDDPILHLILCVKAPDTVSALSAVAGRLSAASSILFLHNGIGIIEEVNTKIFPDPATRPTYLLGVNSHGVNKQPDHPFAIEWAGQGTIAIGPYPEIPDPTSPRAHTLPPFDPSPSARCLMNHIKRVPQLQAAVHPPDQLLALQLEKLAINCVINPLTALLDVRNGYLPYSYSLLRVARLIISEVSLVLRNLPALSHLYNTERRFSPRRLEALWVGVATRTGQNVSSMLADVRFGRGKTEVEYMNGWVHRMGEKLGVTCVTNYGLEKLVKGKATIVQWEKQMDLPFSEETEVKLRDQEEWVRAEREEQRVRRKEKQKEKGNRSVQK
ncbi:hypothetical protein EJ05DRAFT_500969 [Pseudovirgaria hyperparasitica]|uniref:2-dehydropantoate 2-reductase n=1 Tax=Pseudovirgaria hyperparasitica TaxID=470096 RepID=A0A6A6W488_9PEZI|nr:uncharacterized protein EJ05DRAFT_500969 [Pseudovirgaria hyperparasitica]KAF2757433.1 hypothetical protein EJ05DRAFT_500969 [Pseudovirgaria hyperparasitica]